MDHHTYWRKQTADKPLHPDFEWQKPERRDQAGKLALIGGNKLGFAGVAEAYQTADTAGVGTVKTVLPDALKKSIPPVLDDVVFAPSNPSGGLSSEAFAELKAAGEWADAVLFIGDAGRNSETAVLYEQFVDAYQGKLVITRDAVDILRNASQTVVERPDTILVLSFAQLQKLFQAVYYPKVLTFNMQLLQLVEAVHKFTITYPITIVTFHQDQLVISHDGEVITQDWSDPLYIWRGTLATKIASYWLWSQKILPAIAASITSS